MLRGGDVLARAGGAARVRQRAAAADRQPRGGAPRPRAARRPRRGTSIIFYSNNMYHFLFAALLLR